MGQIFRTDLDQFGTKPDIHDLQLFVILLIVTGYRLGRHRACKQSVIYMSNVDCETKICHIMRINKNFVLQDLFYLKYDKNIFMNNKLTAMTM